MEFEATILLVDLLYAMCKVELVIKGEDEKTPNKLNKGKASCKRYTNSTK